MKSLSVLVVVAVLLKSEIYRKRTLAFNHLIILFICLTIMLHDTQYMIIFI